MAPPSAPPAPPIPKIVTVTGEPPVAPVKLPDPKGYKCTECFYCIPRNPKGEITLKLAQKRYKQYKEGGMTQNEFVRLECNIHWCNEEASKEAAELAEAAKEQKRTEEEGAEGGGSEEGFVVEKDGKKVRILGLEVLKLTKAPGMKQAVKKPSGSTSFKMKDSEKKTSKRDAASKQPKKKSVKKPSRSKSSTAENKSEDNKNDSTKTKDEEDKQDKRDKKRRKEIRLEDVESSFVLRYLTQF